MKHASPHSVLALILAGGLRKPPLAEETRRHLLTLPVSSGETLLERWVSVLSPIANGGIRVAVSDPGDAIALGAGAGLRPLIDPQPWRGTAGVIADVAADSAEDVILVVEGSCIPPRQLEALFERLEAGSHFVVGATRKHQPAGVYALRRSVLDLVPASGYMDVKEQLLPRAVAASLEVRMAIVGDALHRVRDWQGFRRALEADTASEPAADQRGQLGKSIIESGAIVEEGTVLNSSVVLRGARVCRGAIISRSLVAAGNVVEKDELIVDRVLAARASASARKVSGSPLPSSVS